MSKKSVHGPKKKSAHGVHTPKKSAYKVCMHFCPSLCLMFLSTEQVKANIYDMDIAQKQCLPKTSLKKTK